MKTPRSAPAEESRRRTEPTKTKKTHEPRSFVSLGWLYHFLYSLKARIALLPMLLLMRACCPGAAAPRRRRCATIRPPSRWSSRTPSPTPIRPTIRPTRSRRRKRKPRSRSRRASASSRPRGPRQGARAATSFPRSRCSPRRRALDRATLSTEAIQENATALESVLGDFGVRGEIINAHPGPVVTLYELEPAPGIKSSRVIGLVRRHRALDEQGVGARRGRARPQRHRHRAAQPEAREGAAARDARRRATTPTRRRACRSASARPSAAIR